MTDNSKALYTFLKDNYGKHFTAVDVAEALGFKTSNVNLLFNIFVKKGIAKRTIGTVELEDGSHTELKFLTLTEYGLNIDPDKE